MTIKTAKGAEIITFSGDIDILGNNVKLDCEVSVTDIDKPNDCAWDLIKATMSEDEDKEPAPTWLLTLLANDESFSETIDNLVEDRMSSLGINPENGVDDETSSDEGDVSTE